MDFLILGNKDFLYQAFLNFVVNAIQYTNEGGKIDVSMASTDYVDKRNVSRNGVEVVVTDTIDIPIHKRFKGLTVLSTAPMLAEAIKRNYEKRSISSLYI